MRRYLKGRIKIRRQITERYEQVTGNPPRDPCASLQMEFVNVTFKTQRQKKIVLKMKNKKTEAKGYMLPSSFL